MNPEGSDYRLLSDQPRDAALTAALEKVRQLLRQSPAHLTPQEIVARRPDGEPPLHADSLWCLLTRGCELGILVRTRAGNKAEAYRYGLVQSQPGA